MKKLTAKIAILLFIVGMLAAGITSCSDDYGDYGDSYGGISNNK